MITTLFERLSDILFILGASITLLGALYLVKNTIFVKTSAAGLDTTSFTSASQSEKANLRANLGDRLRQNRNAKEGFVILMMGVVLEIVAHFTAPF